MRLYAGFVAAPSARMMFLARDHADEPATALDDRKAAPPHGEHQLQHPRQGRRRSTSTTASVITSATLRPMSSL
jgi:hypothetical protein